MVKNDENIRVEDIYYLEFVMPCMLQDSIIYVYNFYTHFMKSIQIVLNSQVYLPRTYRVIKRESILGRIKKVT